MRCRFHSTCIVVIAFSVALTPATLTAEPAAHMAPVKVRGLERDLLADADDGELHRFTLTGAAFVAAGMTEAAELARAEADLARKLSTCASALKHEPDSVARARLALELLHAQLLTGQYRPECTALQETLHAGDYNCVTSTVLYVALCQELEVPVEIIASPGHVLAKAREESAPTNDPFTEVERRVVVAPAREITPCELIGKIYYNRAVEALEVKQYAAAVRWLRLALRFDTHDTAAQDNLLAALNNWALAECDAGNFAAAGEALAQARDVNARWPALLVNDVHVHSRWAAALCREGRYEEAIVLLAGCSDRRPDIRDFAVARAAVERAAGK